MNDAARVADAVSERLKRRAMDAAPVGITIADARRPDVPLVYVNDEFVRITGYSREFALGRNCRFLQGDDTDPERVDRLRQAVNDDRETTVELLNYTADGEPFWNRVEIAPLRDRDGEVTHFVGFQMDVTARREAEEAVREERAALSRLVDRINGLLEGVTGELVRSKNVPELCRRVTGRIVGADPYAAAWIGEASVRGEGVDPDADSLSVGPGGPDPEAVSLPESVTDGAVAAALAEGELRVERDPPTPEGLAAASLAAVPLTYQGATRGVLAVYGREPDTFDEGERVVLASLGRAVAAALDALETRRVLTVEPEVAVEITIRGDLPSIALAGVLGSRLEYVGAMQRDDGREVLTFAAGDAAAADVEGAAADLPAVDDLSVVADHHDGVLVDLVPAGESLVTTLATVGAGIDSLVVSDGGVEVTCALPGGEDVRGVMDALRDRFEHVQLRSKRERTGSPETPDQFVAGVRERLTERQATALRRAYVAGYFDRPRGADGDDLAESMGITRSTFHQHLAAAQRKLLDAFFDGVPD
ncbi:MAG: bacterio-opsin activator domain-containing protein [Halobacteriales archaeon]